MTVRAVVPQARQWQPGGRPGYLGRSSVGLAWYVGRLCRKTFLDKVAATTRRKRQDLWRAVDQKGDELDTLVQGRKDKRAAKRFFRTLLRGQRRIPNELTTERLRSYVAAKREMMPSNVDCRDKYTNNRDAISHGHMGARNPDAGVHHPLRRSGF